MDAVNGVITEDIIISKAKIFGEKVESMIWNLVKARQIPTEDLILN